MVRSLTVTVAVAVCLIVSAASSVAMTLALPVVTAVPTISGTTQRGQVLSVSNGSWANSPTSYSYQWQRCTATYSATVRGDRPSLYWRLDEGSVQTPVADFSGNGRTGNHIGGTVGQPGATSDGDAALKFNGTGSYISAGAPSNYLTGKSFTVESWVKLTSNNGSLNTIAFTGADTSRGFQLAIDLTSGQKNVWWGVGDSVGSIYNHIDTRPVGVSLDDGNYHQIVGVYDYPTKALTTYVDGGEVGSGTLNVNPTWDATGLFVGKWGSNDIYYLNGTLDDFAVYPAALTPARIAAHYSMASGAPNPSTCADIAGATSNSYTLVNADIGVPVRALVTATNDDDSATAFAAKTAAVYLAPPVVTAIPTISGTTERGQTLSVSNGSWTNSPTSYAYQWQRCSAAYSATVRGDSPSLYWRLDEGSVQTSVADFSGNGRTGNHIGGTVGQPGATSDGDAALKFNGTGSYISAGAPSNYLTGKSFTVESWVKLTSNNGSLNTIAQTGVDESRGFQLAIDLRSGLKNVWWGVGGGSGQYNHVDTQPAGVTLDDGHYHQVVGVYDYLTKTLMTYVDGNQAGSLTVSVNPVWDLNGLYVGKWTSTGFYYLNGTLDEFAVYPSALTPASIVAHYNMASTAPNPSTCADIVGATSNSYTLMNADIGVPFRALVTALNADGGTTAFTVKTGAVTGSPAPPGSSSPPTISGTPQDGQILTADPGTWNNGAASYTYQWQQCDASGANCVNATGAGATTSSYTLVAADVGSTIRVVVTATNSTGSASASSSATSVVQVAPPVNTVSPIITGRDEAGQTLTASTGSWSGTAPMTYSYQWQVSTDGGSTWSNATGAEAITNTHTVITDDVNGTFRILVTAGNSAGSATATSGPTPMIINEAALESLARWYRPALLFDSGEHYRPITVDSLLAEKTSQDEGAPYAHTRCDTTSGAYGLYDWPCYPIGSIGDLLAPGPEGMIYTHLSIWPHGGGDDGYHSPSCDPGSFYRDCGDTPGIYYDFGQNSSTGYRFIDYWFFYRYNPAGPAGSDNHEGDWEGVTVFLAPDPGPNPSIAGAIFWTHGVPTYRRSNVFYWCHEGDDNYSQCVGTTSTHLADFVASGSHASYEYWCPGPCWNPAVQLNIESSHQGTNAWADNLSTQCNSDSCTNPLTYIDGRPPESWASWDGRWGASGSLVGAYVHGVGDSPSSPGLQSPFTCTQAGWSCSKVPEGDPLPFSFSAHDQTASNRANTRKRPFTLGRCASWYDGGLSAYACSPSQLKKAVASNRLNKRSSFSITINNHRTGAGPGLVQVVGGPVTPRTLVHFVGKPASDEIVVINCVVGKTEYAITLRHLVLGSRPSARVVLRGAQPLVGLTRMKATQDVTVLRPVKKAVGP